MFSKYYQSELQYLRELGREYGEAHPEAAGMLVERGGDPDVERLLEGFAFLAARIRERAEDAAPEIILQLADLLLPHYARTLPATSIVEFTPVLGAIRGRHRVPRGTEVSSVPVDGTSCRFRTTMDVDLLPLSLTQVAVEKVGSAASTLRASFQVAQKGAPAVLEPAGVRLYLHAEPALQSLLLLWFARHLAEVEVHGDAEAGPRVVRLGREAVRFPAFFAENTLLDWPRLAPEGPRLVQELFLQPARFFFLEVVGLDAAAGAVEEKFDLLFKFDRPPDLPARPARDVLRLCCAPVVNLFKTSTDPLRDDPAAYEHLLRASDVEPRHMEIYSVDEVTGTGAQKGERRRYAPFFAFSHAAGAAAGDELAYYHTRRARSIVDDGIDSFLSIVTPRDVTPRLDEELLSIDVTCTNRSLPAKLRVGDISVPTASSPTMARFKNLSGVSRPVRPPLGSELHWRIVSHLSLGHRSLGETGTLKAFLELYNFDADEQLSRANHLRIEAIRGVELRPAKRFLEGAPIRGAHVTLELEERNFGGRGDAFLFGAVLDELFAQQVTLNSFTELSIRLEPSKAEYAWSPRSGRRTIV